MVKKDGKKNILTKKKVKKGKISLALFLCSCSFVYFHLFICSDSFIFIDLFLEYFKHIICESMERDRITYGGKQVGS